MALDRYRDRRRFDRTPEPEGSAGAAPGGDAYLVQKHAARRLHYDLRLEMDGVLRSWAVARGPSLVPGERRLAVHVEDHPLEYGTFEGTIPKGEYGGGTVILWDRGRWSPIGDARKGYAKGSLDFELHGEKLRGRWHLVRMARRRGDKTDNWLLIKGDDAFARGRDDPDILVERPASVATGRLVEEVAGEAPGWSSRTGRIEPGPPEGPAVPAGTPEAGYPGFVPPALATLRATSPRGDRWLHEIKFDGYRLQAHVISGRVLLLTRSGLDWTDRFGTALPAALAALPVREAILDGELVVEGPSGASDFSALQADLSAGRGDRLVYYGFDILHLDGHDLRPLPQIDRKAALAALLAGAGPPLRYSEHFDESGEMVLRHACRLSLEGVVSKDRNAPYRSGRGTAWIKAKCSLRQEFVVAGFVPSSTTGTAIGSLVLGTYDGDGLVHAGRVGTGFTRAVAADLFRRLEPLVGGRSPFAAKLSTEEARGVTFVRPELVAEVEFRAWTADALVRHASFRGLREDRAPREVRRETADAAAPARTAPAVRLTHPDRIYWPDVGVTKAGLADYYVDAFPRMAPFVVDRPLALVRCPDGVGGQCFFQKHAWRGQSREIVRAFDPRDGSDEPIVAVDGLPGLLGLVQGGVLEIHPWGARLSDLERPDVITMDLDPGPGVAWDDVIEAAREVRERLSAAGLPSFVKTSGGKGLHVVAPLEPRADWATVKAFTRSVAIAMASDAPGRFVATVTQATRTRRILIDSLRNGRGATAVAPYSTRARAGAPVSMPLDWSELGPTIGPASFTVLDVASRLASTPDPWADFRRGARPIDGQARKAA